MPPFIKILLPLLLFMQPEAAATEHPAAFCDDKGRLIPNSIPDIDITTEKIVFDLYPTLINVDIHLDIVNKSDSIKNFNMMLIECENDHTSLINCCDYPPLDNLQITLGDAVVDTRYSVSHYYRDNPFENICGPNKRRCDSSGVLKILSGIGKIREEKLFRQFELSLSPHEKKTVTINFVQMLYNHIFGEDSTMVYYYYPFPLNRMWGKPIKNVEIDFKRHWDTGVGVIQKNSYPHFQHDTASQWKYDSLDADEGIAIKMTFPNTWITLVSSGAAPYTMNALSNALILEDRIIRFNRARGFSPKNWNSFIEVLLRNSSNGRDTALNKASRKILSDFRFYLIRNWWEYYQRGYEERDAFYTMSYDKAEKFRIEKLVAYSYPLWTINPLTIDPVLVKRYKKVKRCLKWLTPKGDSILPAGVAGNTPRNKSIADREQGLPRFKICSSSLESPLLAGHVYLLIVSNMRHSKRLKILFVISMCLLASGTVCVYAYRMKKITTEGKKLGAGRGKTGKK